MVYFVKDIRMLPFCNLTSLTFSRLLYYPLGLLDWKFHICAVKTSSVFLPVLPSPTSSSFKINNRSELLVINISGL